LIMIQIIMIHPQDDEYHHGLIGYYSKVMLIHKSCHIAVLLIFVHRIIDQYMPHLNLVFAVQVQEMMEVVVAVAKSMKHLLIGRYEENQRMRYVASLDRVNRRLFAFPEL